MEYLFDDTNHRACTTRPHVILRRLLIELAEQKRKLVHCVTSLSHGALS